MTAVASSPWFWGLGIALGPSVLALGVGAFINAGKGPDLHEGHNDYANPDTNKDSA